MPDKDENKKGTRSKFQRHSNILIWKSYLQRQRRWRALVAESLVSGILFLIAVFIAKPVFLTPMQAHPDPALSDSAILKTLNALERKTIVGFAPNVEPFKADKIWNITIRSTERALYETKVKNTSNPNPHLVAGFLAVQMAISQAIVEHSASGSARYSLSLVAMPVSPLMEETKVRKAITSILLCFTLALIPPVLETESLRALRIRSVEYSAMYFGWLVFAIFSALPSCLLAAVSLILIFRWIHLVFALVLMMAYVSVMIMMALIMAMFHKTDEANAEDSNTLFYTIVSWSGLNLVYFLILLLLQRTIGQERAIGKERERLQEVEELVAKAISFRDVSKSIMGVPVLSNITLDIYRGDFTVLFAERMQQKMINTIEDLLTGLAFADKGTIVVLGHTLKPKKNYMTVPHMMGYCHDYMFLIDDLTICLWSESRQYISEYGDVRTRRLIKECHLEVVRHERVKDLDMCFTSIKLEYADRVFLFDSKILTFGGTPAYMFLKYGREYRVRMTIRSDSTFDDESTTKLLKRSTEAGATIRAHQGSLIILRLPVSPTKNVVDLVTDLTKNANKYGMTTLNITIGVGLSFSSMLEQLERDFTAKLIHGDLLTVENVDSRTTLVIRSDTSEAAKSLASAYVLSETNATKQQVAKMMYTALNHNQSLTEYLATVAIDSPQMYVYMYAYGLDVYTDRNTLFVQALYSPLHFDNAVAARSIARSYTALLRYYSKNLEASIRITDDPLALDLTSWMLYATRPPLSIQFLLIMSLSHITLLPSKEHGLIRHLQSHATNFSPARYWFNLYLCDLVLYSILATLMTGMMMLTMYLATPVDHFQYEDLLIVPFSLIMYGVGGIPQAYLFSLGPRAALNAMTFFIVNLVFGGIYTLHSVYLGLAKGEALALSGLKRHGRLQLCEILAGYTRASEGKLWCMSKWKQQTLHHMYARQISFSSEHESLPHWMTVYDALELIGLLRGIPREHIRTEINNYIEALGDVESHMPVTNRIAILLCGRIYDIDTVDNLVERYSKKGYTVVLHLKEPVDDVTNMFKKYFKAFAINDTSEVLVNVQILEEGLTWASIFQKMEALKTDNDKVYSYIVTVIPINYIYNSILLKEADNKRLGKKSLRSKFSPSDDNWAQLKSFEPKYGVTELKELPWSVIFNT
ncbi:Uncharacterized protein OBRU01_16833 [Operophtera brumata]|uniref:Uncharacterized protein n=1 Tax=Operophtera brumata TaxID=104452 RepID=A0A0L7L2E1_OPEBR|nr:Uncharacterized protein OBRU01_16833 [Operophtera brumata]